MPPPHPTGAQAPAPTLPEELLEEIFLRFPPDEPACLVRASFGSKLWLGLLTGPAFRSRYSDFHGAPPMLGFFHSGSSDSGPHFAPTGARLPGVDNWVGWHKDHVVWDCRHGRVLLCNKNMLPLLLVAWDPMTGSRMKLPAPKEYDSHGAAVLCRATSCDHRACHEGPFQVVFVGLDYSNDGCAAYAHVSLPETGEWSEPCSALELATKNASLLDMPPVSVQDALCFLLTYMYYDAEHANDIVILKYDLTSHCLSLIDVPPVETDTVGDNILMVMEDGGLGFARFDGLTIYIWSRQMGSDGVPAWTRSRVMDLKNLLPIRNPKKRVRLIGSMEGSDIIFFTTDLGIYKINLKSLQWKKIWQREDFHALIPYRSFYNQPERATPCDAAQLKFAQG